MVDLKSSPATTAIITLGNFFFRYRGYTPLPVVLIYFYLSRPTWDSLLLGNMVMAVGEMGRLWAICYTGRPARSRVIGAAALVTGGPFAFIRNPLYACNLIIYSGVVLMGHLNLYLWLPLVWGYFGWQYYCIVQLEETSLSELFGERYRKYLQTVPAFFPGFRKPGGPDAGPSLSLKAALVVERSALLQWAIVSAGFLMKRMLSA